MGETCHVAEVLSAYPHDPRYLLAILLDIQENEKYLSQEAMRSAAEYVGVPESRVFAVATFYSTLSLRKKGRRVIRVCNGTACHMKGAGAVLQSLSRAVGAEPFATSADGEYTLETVNCVGACALAPVVVVENRTYGRVSAAEAVSIAEKERAL